MFNRLLRRFGVGRSLFREEGLRIRYQGDDIVDREQFRVYLKDKLPYGFRYGSEDKPDQREDEFRAWTTQYAVGRYWHSYNPIYLTGEVRFESNADALAFRVTFNNLHDLNLDEND
ncbi:MAG: hypothetical protein EOP83_01625 [Verrucomicrobiaceae bacterium]|nr:MAG: hypothetical protein EOP83_01625 [Verrucomicrobiaceae bacterium]